MAPPLFAWLMIVPLIFFAWSAHATTGDVIRISISDPIAVDDAKPVIFPEWPKISITQIYERESEFNDSPMGSIQPKPKSRDNAIRLCNVKRQYGYWSLVPCPSES